MAEHTQTPWHLGSTGHTELVMGFKGDREVILAELGIETDTSFDDDRANAAFIVKACNAFDEMQEVLADLWLHFWTTDDPALRSIVEHARRLLPDPGTLSDVGGEKL